MTGGEEELCPLEDGPRTDIGIWGDAVRGGVSGRSAGSVGIDIAGEGVDSTGRGRVGSNAGEEFEGILFEGIPNAS